MQNTALFLYGGGALAFLMVAAVILLRPRQVFDPASGLAAVLALSAWQATLAWNTVHPLPGQLLMAAESVRVLGLLVYLARSLRAAAGHWPTAAATVTSTVMTLGIPLLLATLPQLAGNSGMEFTALRAWSGVFISVGLLIALEQVFRNAAESLSLLRYSCVALGIAVIYDLYLFADTLIFERAFIDPDLWAARGGVNAICAVFLGVAISRSRVTRAISFSRSVVFYTASLTAAGLFLFTVSVIGFSLRSVGGSWGAVLQLMLFFGALLLIVTASLSQRFRDSLRGRIVRNFFALRYDYREEWLNLIKEMSAGGDGDELYVRAVRLMADLYKCPGACCGCAMMGSSCRWRHAG